MARVFDEFKAALWQHPGLPALPRIEGMPVGIIANNGILFSESALKGAHFIELCCQRKIPLVFLQNITGFMVGRKYENEGIARAWRQAGDGGGHGARVPKFTRGDRRLVWCRQLRHVRAAPSARASCGCGRTHASAYGRRAGRQRAGHGQARMASRPRAASGAPRKRRPSRRRSASSTKHQGHPYYASARLWDDGVIGPADTRRVLALGLSAACNAPSKTQVRHLPHVKDRGCRAAPSPALARAPCCWHRWHRRGGRNPHPGAGAGDGSCRSGGAASSCRSPVSRRCTARRLAGGRDQPWPSS